MIVSFTQLLVLSCKQRCSKKHKIDHPLQQREKMIGPILFASAAQLHSPLVAACHGSTGSVRGESESRAGGKERGLQEAPDDLLELAECSSLSSTLTTASTTAPPASAETTPVVDSGPQLPSAQAVQLHGDPRAWQGPHAPDYEWWDEEELDPHFFPCTPEAHASRVTPLTLRRTVAWQWWVHCHILIH